MVPCGVNRCSNTDFPQQNKSNIIENITKINTKTKKYKWIKKILKNSKQNNATYFSVFFLFN